MSEEKKGAERLDPTSIDAMHWAECFCEQVEINSEDEVHIDPEFLMAYFANFWAAVNDPLQNTIESQAAELSALREREKELEEALSNFMRWREALLRSEVLPDLPEVEMVRQARELLSTRREEG